jgi:hypothetical protein
MNAPNTSADTLPEVSSNDSTFTKAWTVVRFTVDGFGIVNVADCIVLFVVGGETVVLALPEIP